MPLLRKGRRDYNYYKYFQTFSRAEFFLQIRPYIEPQSTGRLGGSVT